MVKLFQMLADHVIRSLGRQPTTREDFEVTIKKQIHRLRLDATLEMLSARHLMQDCEFATQDTRERRAFNSQVMFDLADQLERQLRLGF